MEFLVLRRIWPILGSVYVVFRFAGFLQFSFWFSFLSTIFGGLSDFEFFLSNCIFRFSWVCQGITPCFHYSSSFSNDDFSALKTLTKEARLLRNDMQSLISRFHN